ncbi:hypothetical protein D3C85_1506240 [compost metagenome]
MAKKLMLSKPKALRSTFTPPSCVRRNNIVIPTITTQDKKCGAYNMVCIEFLKYLILTSLSKSASRIGKGKPTNTSNRFRYNVFFNNSKKSVSEKSRTKLSNPIHSLFQTPRNGV